MALICVQVSLLNFFLTASRRLSVSKFKKKNCSPCGDTLWVEIKVHLESCAKCLKMEEARTESEIPCEGRSAGIVHRDDKTMQKWYFTREWMPRSLSSFLAQRPKDTHADKKNWDKRLPSASSPVVCAAASSYNRGHHRHKSIAKNRIW